MKAKRPARGTASGSARPREVRKRSQARVGGGSTREPKRMADAPQRSRKPTRDARPQRSAPQTSPIARPADGPARPKNTSQAKARAKARKAKAPKVVRPPLRQRILVKLASIDVNPRALVSRVPFVVLVIGALGVGLGVTLWLSTDAAERSYQLGHARQVNEALLQQKEGLERDVLEAQAAPALAEAARNLGMIPSRDTAHLVQDAAGNWVVVGTPKPAEGLPPPPLNAPLPDPAPAAPSAPRVVEPREVPVRLPAAPVPHGVPGAPAVPLAAAPGEVPHAASGELPVLGPVPPAGAAAPIELPAAPLDAGPSHLAPGAVTQPGAPVGTEQPLAAAPAPGAPA